MTTHGPALQRVLVGGISGAGKSTMASALSSRLGLPYVEVDGLFHGPGWVQRPEFEADVAAIAAGDRWVIEDQYHRVLGDLLWRRADTLIWLDMPRALVMWRLLRRSIRRSVTRAELWNGNREKAREWFTRDHPVRYAWDHHGERRAMYEELAVNPAYPNLTVLRFRSPTEATEWLLRVRAPGAAG